VREADGRREGFAASACGSGEVPIAWMMRRALETEGPCESLWGEGGAPRIDLESGSSLASASELEDWLARALSRLDAALSSRGTEQRPAVAWIEAGVTVEALVHDAGLAALRVRGRVWASATHQDRQALDAPERPHVVAARRVDGLDPERWAREIEVPSERGCVSSRTSDRPVALAPAAAASLVTGIVAALHGRGAPLGGKVGAGWELSDDPLHPEALVGGVFDDVGFTSRRLVLASGGEVRGRLEGEGCFRRASYRDRPESSPSLLVVTGLESPVPEGAWRVASARVHPGGAGSCLVELDALEGDGGGNGVSARLIATPERIAAACSGSFGPPRLAGWGVFTPGLILEGLRVEP
jgi:hypothetical protein